MLQILLEQLIPPKVMVTESSVIGTGLCGHHRIGRDQQLTVQHTEHCRIRTV